MSTGILERRAGTDSVVVTLGGVQLPSSIVADIQITHGRTTPGLKRRQQPAVCALQLYRAPDDVSPFPELGDVLTVDLGEDARDWLASDPQTDISWNNVDPDATWAEFAGYDTPWGFSIASQSWNEVDADTTWADVGDGLTWGYQSGAVTRFTGEVSDGVARPTGSNVHGPSVLTLTATSKRARLNRVALDWSGGEGTPAADYAYSGYHAQQWLEFFAVPKGFTLGTFELAAGAVDWAPHIGGFTNLGESLDNLAAQTQSELVEERNGDLSWQDPSHRSSASPVVLTLDDSEALARPESRIDRSTIVNDVTIEHFEDGTGAPMSTVMTDSDSADRHGVFAESLGTALGETAAAQLATQVLQAWATPRWTMPRLRAELLRGVKPYKAAQLLGLVMGDLIAVTDFPASGPFQESQLFVEGWTERISRNGYQLDLAVSDPALTLSDPL